MFCWMPLRAEILQNLSKIKQNQSPKNKSITQVFVRFCLDFVGFLAEGDPQERNYSLFASQKQCFHHLKTVFLPPKTHVFGV